MQYVVYHVLYTVYWILYTATSNLGKEMGHQLYSLKREMGSLLRRWGWRLHSLRADGDSTPTLS